MEGNKVMEECEQKVYTQAEVETIVANLKKRFEQEMRQMNNVMTRVNLLFQVVKLKDTFSTDFYLKCVQELENILDISNPENSDDEE